MDGNLPYAASASNEKITGLLFDVSGQPDLFTAGYGKSNEMNVAPGDVICITSRKSSVQDFGIQERVACDPDEEANENFLFGIPAYHIREFFRMGGNIDGPGRLYVMFADCSQNWDALDVMQRAADGLISQVGIWTEQPLWKLNGEQEKYNLNLVKGINDKAVALAELNQPLSVVLCANLPYNITTPFLTACVEARCFDSLTVLIQKEVAQRICAAPGTADYGAFTLLMQYYTRPELLFTVPNTCFLPAPKVTSAVIRCATRTAPPVQVRSETAFWRTVRAGFALRRKTLVNSLQTLSLIHISEPTRPY